MGLRDYRKFKKEQELKESETISLLLNRIASLEAEVKELKTLIASPVVQSIKLTDEEKGIIAKASEGKATPQEFISLFTEDLQEFDPNA